MHKNVMTTRSRQRVTKMATVSVNMERYNEDEVGVSVWACPIYGGGRVVWCGRCLSLRVGVCSCVGGGVVGSAKEREEVGSGLVSATEDQLVVWTLKESRPPLIQASVLALLSTSEVYWYNEG